MPCNACVVLPLDQAVQVVHWTVSRVLSVSAKILRWRRELAQLVKEQGCPLSSKRFCPRFRKLLSWLFWAAYVLPPPRSLFTSGAEFGHIPQASPAHHGPDILVSYLITCWSARTNLVVSPCPGGDVGDCCFHGHVLLTTRPEKNMVNHATHDLQDGAPPT